MKKWLYEHSLGVTLVSIYVFFKVGSAWVPEDASFWSATFHGHSDDAFGAILIVLLTKWLREKDSPESK